MSSIPDSLTVSVIIPCRNEAAYIAQTLDAILKQSFPLSEVEVMVIDGMSTDATRSILDAYSGRFPHFRAIDNPRFITAAAMNIGIQAASGKYVAIVGAHSEPPQNYISACLNSIRQDPEIACVGGALETLGRSFVGRAIAKAMSSPFGVGNAQFRFAQKECIVDTVAFGFYRRSIFDQIGLFDEDLIFAEDDELNFRISQVGKSFRLLPEVTFQYYARDTYRALCIQYYRYGKGKVKVLRKHSRVPSWRALVPPTFILSLLFSLLGGLVFYPFLVLGNGILIFYMLAGIASATILAWPEIKLAPAILFAFVCMHTSYGTGFLEGLLQWPVEAIRQ